MGKEGAFISLILLLLVCFLCSSRGGGGGGVVFVSAEGKVVRHSQGNESRSWCIVKPSTSQEKLDDIIQYCCTQSKVDCKVIQAGGSCYRPPNKISDASVVMNIYYHLHGTQNFTCDFKGSGLIVKTDPSVDKCIYQA
ncbi:hypothetical protein Salat_2290500 [Sesamum alatum]|uniref:X8 domain-containing protein n=1 Tax=Sesamum alatum TaxID=300844 RepID=A0AAE1XVK2_9LAMI|nr:hypothetical protein Salat_2290500 [Sesamum alatum]